MATAERLRDRGRLSDTLLQISELCFFQGNWQHLQDYAERLMGPTLQSFAILTRLAVMQYELGDYISGEATMARLMEQRSVATTELQGFT